MSRWLKSSDVATGERRILRGPFERTIGLGWKATVPGPPGDDHAHRYRSKLCLYENGKRLTAAHQHSVAINQGGEGRYMHWENHLLFSTPDGSNPNTNGRKYTFDHSLEMVEWERDRVARACKRWNLHPRGAEFLARGGDAVPPPHTVNLGMTNKCNLRCEICGSQKHLDNTGVRRRHMEFDTFSAVAETLFPLLSLVELNSQGDPLLHPRIQDVLRTIQRHRCEVKIQHNGTLLTNSLIDLIMQQHGIIMLSLDAVGEKFDEVRRGGVWAKAHVGLERLVRDRDPARLSVGVYPTLTKRTIGEALNVANWCLERRIENVGFHRYVPIQGSFEEAPTDREYDQLCDKLRRWCDDTNDAVEVQFEGTRLNRTWFPDKRTEFADVQKKVTLIESGKFMFPMEAGKSGADYFTSCASPSEYAEIGLDGQLGACCRAQDVVLGKATSVDSFADAWLGDNYARIRRSLRRGAKGRYPLPNCAGCVKFFAPSEAAGREAINYAEEPKPGDRGRLEFSASGEVEVEVIQKDEGNSFVAVFPVGFGGGSFDLWEDDRRLGPAYATHEEIRTDGKGAFALGATDVYFSSSDGTDPRRNGRAYILRAAATPTGQIRLERIMPEQDRCFIVEFASAHTDITMELWEDGRCLGPQYAEHNEIRQTGGGAYSLEPKTLRFSSSDGTDPRRNGRAYTLRPVRPIPDGAIRLDRINRAVGQCVVFEFEIPMEDLAYELWEDDRRLGPQYAEHDEIRQTGAGAYSVEHSAVLFSSSKGDDPRRNGCVYTLRPPAKIPEGAKRVDRIEPEIGHCVVFKFAAPINNLDYELWEDGKRLGPRSASHDEIRHEGLGAYSVGSHSLLFSSSDGTDPRRNGRLYVLRSREKSDCAEPILDMIRKDSGLCYIALLPAELEAGRYGLREDGQWLGPAQAMHDDICQNGMGRYHLGGKTLYFSSSDGTDPRRNGRTYTLRAVAGA